MDKRYQDIIISLENKETTFESIWKDVYLYQRENNPIYKEFLQLIGRYDQLPATPADIAFAPISFFKTQEIKTGEWEPITLFRSSGTGGDRSQHLIRHLAFYHQNAADLFEVYFDDIAGIEFLGLLPNYHDNPDSSLLSMVSHFMDRSMHDCAYYLDDQAGLCRHIEANKVLGRPTVLFGVSFALLDYTEQYEHDGLDDLIVIETGGMKKFRREMTRAEIHGELARCFTDAQICSEYGMSECLSQLYSTHDGRFEMNERMRIVITDPTDPFQVLPNGRKGRVNILDLANVHSMSFFATDDIGVVHADQTVEILGRMDSADLRGCNYLI